VCNTQLKRLRRFDVYSVGENSTGRSDWAFLARIAEDTFRTNVTL